MLDLDLTSAFVVFDAQDSGCLSYGVEADGRRWFVKTAGAPHARQPLVRAGRLHRAVRHPAIVRPERIIDGPGGPVLVYQWHDGSVLNRATAHGSDRTALTRFQQLPIPVVEAAIDTILDAHLTVTAAGFVAVDLYDGCFLYDFSTRRMRLIDLDEYRPGPFILETDRLPGSRRYMAPEEFVRGSVIDQRTTVFTLGRTIQHLLDGPGSWRGSAAQRDVADRATEASAALRYSDVAALLRAWRHACEATKD